MKEYLITEEERDKLIYFIDRKYLKEMLKSKQPVELLIDSKIICNDDRSLLHHTYFDEWYRDNIDELFEKYDGKQIKIYVEEIK